MRFGPGEAAVGTIPLRAATLMPARIPRMRTPPVNETTAPRSAVFRCCAITALTHACTGKMVPAANASEPKPRPSYQVKSENSGSIESTAPPASTQSAAMRHGVGRRCEQDEEVDAHFRCGNLALAEVALAATRSARCLTDAW